MKVIIAGLGRMGMQIAQRLTEEGHTVVAYNRTAAKVDTAKGFGAVAAYSKEDAVKAFTNEPIVLWLMVPADVVDEEMDSWLTLLKADDILVDGGNSDYRHTKVRDGRAKARHVQLIDVGTSGGILGLARGFSMMAGGEPDAFSVVEPLLKALSKPHGAYQYFGSSGSGHFVKMVHNAIEYGMMQSLSEGYRLLQEGPYPKLDLAAAGEVWQHGSVIESLLNDLSRQALVENPQLDGIEGQVAETGEARWALETAKQRHIPMPAIQTAFDIRLASQKGEINFATKLLAAMRNKFGGHALNPDDQPHEQSN